MAREIRGDVQGLRAVAVLTVIAGHYGVPHLSGGFIGVDVFYVISGYLISGLLYREVAVRGNFSITRFWSRRARRILPAATLVTSATILVSLFWLSLVETRQVVTDALWSTFFAANVHFAELGTNYFDKDLPPSPVQHYWSLAVEEQFYLVWPLLLLACLLLTRLSLRRRGRARRARQQRFPRRIVFVMLALVVGASFYLSVTQTVSNPDTAYFSTFTRAWELGVGCLAAMATPRFLRNMRGATASIGSVLGAAAIVASCLFFTPATQFPGYAAALPVLGTALLLVAGAGTHLSFVAKGLSLKPVRRIGDWSYSLYLWHWPVLILAPRVVGVDHLTGLERGGAAAAVFVLSYLTYTFVEMPFRNGRPARVLRVRRALVLYPVSLALVAATSGYAWHDTAVRYAHRPYVPGITVEPNESIAQLVHASVVAADEGQSVPSRLDPDLLHLRDSIAPVAPCDYEKNVRITCTRGDASGTKTLVLIGDSHARAWIPAFDVITTEAHWKAYYFVKPQCTAAHVSVAEVDHTTPFTDCADFQNWVTQQVDNLHPDLVVVATSPPVNGVFDGDEQVRSISRMRPLLREGYRDLFEDLHAGAERVVLLRDVPKSSTDPATCLSSGNPTLGDCTFTPEARSRQLGNIAVSAAAATDTAVVDPLPWLCYHGQCPVVVGGLITYRDLDHITTEYSQSLAQTLGRRLAMLPKLPVS